MNRLEIVDKEQEHRLKAEALLSSHVPGLHSPAGIQSAIAHAVLALLYEVKLQDGQ